VAASYDNTGRYGAQTPFSDQLADHWEGGLWQVDSTHNSIIAVTNGGTKATDALLTFLYNGGKDKYELQKTIAPGDQLWLNLGDLIHNGVPDRNGKVLPSSLTSGTYNLQDMKPAKSLAGSLFEGKIIVDKTWGHLTYGCMICCGYGPAGLDPDPLGLPLPGSGFAGAMVFDNCSGAELPGSFPTSWWTDNAAIATNAADGSVVAASAGSTIDHGRGLLQSGSGEDIGHQGEHCPMLTATDSGGVNVIPCPTTISISSTITEDLSRVLNTFHTGIGIDTTMLVGPGTGYNGAIITESLSMIFPSSTCPSADYGDCSAAGSFTVGLVGPFTLHDGTSVPGQPNSINDEHATGNAVSLLDRDGITHCHVTCSQTYSCNGQPLSPSFQIDRDFTKDTIQGVPVTRVTVTKQ